jgi:tRNA 2-selenouridine synthase
MARHRGSLLGEMPGGQPSQKAFESALAIAVMKLDPSRPVVVEAESSKIGRIVLPPKLWETMCNAQRIEIKAPLRERAKYLTATYADIIADPDRLRTRLQPIRQHRGHDTVDQWEALLSAGDHIGLATSLMVDHYDPAYAKSQASHGRPAFAKITAETLDFEGQTAAAKAIAQVVTAP